MDTLKHKVAALVNHISLRTGIATPKHIDNMFAMRGQRLNSGICKLLPTQRRMTIRLMSPHRQRGIQQQHALFCPARQIARGWNRRTQVARDRDPVR